jgi:prophage regulatory protein
MAELELIRIKEVRRRTGLSTTSIYRAMAADEFPRQVSLLGRRHVGWIGVEVDRWIQARIDAARNPPVAPAKTNGHEPAETEAPSGKGTRRSSPCRRRSAEPRAPEAC